jgi:hypothetical protein
VRPFSEQAVSDVDLKVRVGFIFLNSTRVLNNLLLPNSYLIFNVLLYSLWDQITKTFNNSSGREQPSTKEQLVKLARNIRQVERRTLDEAVLIDRKNLSKFKTSCSRTGGGRGDNPPKGNIVYSCITLQIFT